MEIKTFMLLFIRYKFFGDMTRIRKTPFDGMLCSSFLFLFYHFRLAKLIFLGLKNYSSIEFYVPLAGVQK